MLSRKACLSVFVSVFVFVAISLFFIQPVAATPNVRVFFNGTEIQYDVPPQIILGRTMVPIAPTVYAITGNTVNWDGATSTISFNSFGRYIRHRIGETVIYADGVPAEFDTPSLIIGGRTLVPIQMIAKTADAQVEWDPVNYYVIITRAITTPVPPIAVDPPVAPVPPVAVVPPVDPVPPIAAVPNINRVEADSTEINAGDPVTFTIRTNEPANYVWVHYDNKDLYARYTSTDAAGYKVWAVTFYPEKSQTVSIYANTSRSFTGAAKENRKITVDAHEITIYDVSADRTTVGYGESVYITVTTNEYATSVRGSNGGRAVDFTYRSTNRGRKTWTGTYYPDATTKLWIYAGGDGGNEASDSIRIYVERTERPDIFKITVDPGYVVSGASAELNDFAVTTNRSVVSVYMYVDGRRYSAEPGNGYQSGDLVWYINRVPLTSNAYGGSFDVTIIAENRDGQDVRRNTSISIRPGVMPLPEPVPPVGTTPY